MSRKPIKLAAFSLHEYIPASVRRVKIKMKGSETDDA